MLGKKIALGFGIAIIFPMMVHYGFATFSAPPTQPKFETLNYGYSKIDQDGKRVIIEPTEEQKNELANKITEAVKESLGSSDDYISVAIEDVPKLEWKTKVFDPEIIGKSELLYKKPDYAPPE